MSFRIFSLFVLLVTTVHAVAFWRMECPGSTYGRLDPIVDIGVPASHMHTIHGGSNFGMTTTTDDLLKSSCTSCRIMQDKSAYWTPTLYFQNDNGQFELVTQDGGMIVYYLNRGGNVKAFPKGFRMLAGDTHLRHYDGPFPDKATSFWSASDFTQSNLQQKALGFNCLNYGKGTNEPTLYRHSMPEKAFMDQQCGDGLRLELVFPSCWNGKDLDSPNHRDHMAYPSFVQTGDCPEGFPIRLPTLLYETKWRTDHLAKKKGQFVLSNGDPSGNGYHGDFITGWEPSFLQQAIDTCINTVSGVLSDCPLFQLQTEDKARTCKIKLPRELQAEDAEKPGKTLPGNVPVQAGPGYATKPGGVAPVASSTKTANQQSSSSAPVSSTDEKTSSIPTTTSASTSSFSRTQTRLPNSPVNLAEVAAVTPSSITQPPSSNTRQVVYTTYTSGGAVYEVQIEQIEVTVTATETIYVDGSSKHKRHVHDHAAMHRRNHHLHGHH